MIQERIQRQERVDIATLRDETIAIIALDFLYHLTLAARRCTHVTTFDQNAMKGLKARPPNFQEWGTAFGRSKPGRATEKLPQHKAPGILLGALYW